MNEVVVIGAGISGLSTAYSLLQEAGRLNRPLSLRVLEANSRAGGNIWTERTDGYVFEWGPDGFLDNSPPTLELCRSLELESRLVHAAKEIAKRRYLLLRGRLVELPSSPPGFLTSRVLPLRSRLRAALEPLMPRGARNGREESVGAFARRRLGAEFAKVLVDAMVTGIYGGDPEELSVEAAFPKLKKLETEYGSLIRGAVAQARQRRKAVKNTPDSATQGLQTGPSGVLTSFKTGLSELIQALGERLGPSRLITGAKVERLIRNGPRIAVEAGGERINADHVVLCVPPYRGQEIVSDASPELAEALAPFPTAPIAVVCLGFRREDVGHPLTGFGFLVPGCENLPLLGCVFSSSVYADRAPQGTVLLRAMLGGRRQSWAVDLTESDIQQEAVKILGPVLDLKGPPVLVRVVRHPRGIPQYTLGHLARVGAVRQAAAAVPGLHVSGNAFDGVAINDCIRNGTELGRRLAGALPVES